MSNQNNKTNRIRFAQTATVAITAMAAALTMTAAHAQEDEDSAAMAPPVAGTSAAPTGNSGGSASANVFQWQDVPQNRQVPITRAVFDQGGYQLTDDQGETIVVPFANQNLYVMRFGQSSGGMYFVNDGNTPTLYIPRNGYLENASAQGARWYPFPQSYTYTEPVYVGPAPSWSDYYAMAWYPGMLYYGGYYGYEPWSFGIEFAPFPGLCFSIFDHPYYGWGAYHTFYSYHPDGRAFIRDGARFGGYGVGRRGSDYFASHTSHFGGNGSHYAAFQGAPSHFSGTNVASRSFGASSNTSRVFRGGLGNGTTGGRVGGGSYSGGHLSGGSFSGGNVGNGSGNRSFMGGSSGSGNRSFMGGSGDNRSFSGGGSHVSSGSFSGGNFGGGESHMSGGGNFGGGGGHMGGGSFGGGGGGGRR